MTEKNVRSILYIKKDINSAWKIAEEEEGIISDTETELKDIYREYKFVYDNWFINLNMDVIVYLDYVGGVHVPTKILYDGFWKVLFFKKERADFNLKLFDYQIK